jgi:hypothetical protein
MSIKSTIVDAAHKMLHTILEEGIKEPILEIHVDDSTYRKLLSECESSMIYAHASYSSGRDEIFIYAPGDHKVKIVEAKDSKNRRAARLQERVDELTTYIKELKEETT